MTYRRISSSQEDTSLSVWRSVVSGSCAGAVQTVIACPMELVKIRMQNQSIGKQYVSWTMRKMGVAPVEGAYKDYKGPLQMTREIIQRNGPLGMYKGWWLTQIREIPQFGIYFGSYAWIRQKIAHLTSQSSEELGLFHLATAGGLTGVVTWVWYPVDVIKSRFQNDVANEYRGILDCLRKSVQSEGMRVLVRGLQPTLVRGFFNGFATLPIYTLIMRLLNSEQSWDIFLNSSITFL